MQKIYMYSLVTIICESAMAALPHSNAEKNMTQDIQRSQIINRITHTLMPADSHTSKATRKNAVDADLLSQIAHVVFSNLDEHDTEKAILDIVKSKNITTKTLQILLERIQQAKQTDKTKKLFIAIHNIIAKQHVLNAKKKRKNKKHKRQTNPISAAIHRLTA